MKAEDLIIAERKWRDYNDAVRHYKQMLSQKIVAISIMPFGDRPGDRATLQQVSAGQEQILTERWHDLLWDKCRELAADLHQMGVEGVELPSTPDELRIAKAHQPAEEDVSCDK